MGLVETLKDAWRQVAAYFAATDAEASARNTIAATVIGNIPFYPLYLAWIVGGRAWPGLLAFLSLPLFVAVPAAGRRSARAGRICLIAAGLVDTSLCTLGLGAGSGVELFYLPIALLPIALYRGESLPARVVMLGAIVAIFGLGRAIGGALEAYSPAELHNMVILHAVSVLGLSVLIIVLRWRMRAA